MVGVRHGVLKAIGLLVVLVFGIQSGDPLSARQAEGFHKKSKLDRVLRKAVAGGDRSAQRVIVRTRPGKTDAVRERLEKHGDSVKGKHERLNALSLTVHHEDLQALSADPDVESVSIDAIIKADRVSQDADAQNGRIENVLVAALGLNDMPYSGDKVGIAVIDSGLEESGDLSGGRSDKFFDFTVDGRKAHPYDDYGHGTHVATLIAGKGKESELEVEAFENGKRTTKKVELYRGIASKARVISFKVLDGEGAGYTSAVLSALEFAIENREHLGIDIINLSLGHPIYESPETDPLVQAVEQATRAGIIVVTSAGNYGVNQETGEVGYAGIASPGNAPSAITVGALDTHGTATRADDTVAPYSSRGPAWYSGLAKPDIVAPGHRLVAVGAYKGSLYARHAERRVSGRDDKKERYLRLSGTSMAAAVTSGVIALMVEANREFHDAPLTPNAVKAILEYTAIPLLSTDHLTQGAGSLNGEGAVRLAAAIDPAVSAGEWWLTTPVTPVTVVNGEALTWGQYFVWGNNLVSGNAIFENHSAWALNRVWGNYFVWGNADIVWDDPTTWSQTIVWGNSLLSTDGGAPLTSSTTVWGNLVK